MAETEIEIDLRTVSDTFWCSYCKGQRPNELFSRDHILPKSWGGTDAVDNLRPCCRPCNSLMQQAAECPAILACAWAVSEHYEGPHHKGRITRRIRKILSEWKPWQYVVFVAPNTPMAVKLPATTHARTAGITRLKRTYSRSSRGWV